MVSKRTGKPRNETYDKLFPIRSTCLGAADLAFNIDFLLGSLLHKGSIRHEKVRLGVLDRSADNLMLDSPGNSCFF